ncbi:hypothetical protein HU200_010096 [Digitaria exilis]|uniref:Uncharacterized protein n=1 Tax=Digitaria exilis TaxID=1010633 RepID=A0A835FIN4_9POAL|nr:hypothetical protein HU200_010096 [Digitaria exilis]
MAVFFLVCAVLAMTAESTRMGQRGELPVAGDDAGGGDSGNVRYWGQPQGFLGRRPRLASFTRRDGVAVSGENGGSKREVPSGPDPIHHGGEAPSSAAPTMP